MDRMRQICLRPLPLLFAALLLRAVIPAGYMPAGADSDLWFEFCPEGVSAEFMQALAGESSDGHHHDNSHDNHDDHKCPVGHMLSSAAAVDHSWQPAIVPADAPLTTITHYAFTSVSRTNYHSRGPPA